MAGARSLVRLCRSATAYRSIIRARITAFPRFRVKKLVSTTPADSHEAAVVNIRKVNALVAGVGESVRLLPAYFTYLAVWVALSSPS